MLVPNRFALLAGLALPLTAVGAQAQSIIAEDVVRLGMDDAVFTPNGQYVVLRDNTQSTTALVLDAQTGAVLFDEFVGGIAFSGACQDAVAATNDRAIVIGSQTMIIDLTTMTTLALHDTGKFPRDVEITPDGTIAAVRGGTMEDGQQGAGLFLFDMNTGAMLANSPGQPGYLFTGVSGPSFDVDSVAVSNDHAVFTSLVNGGPGGAEDETMVTVYDLNPAGGGPPQLVYESSSPLHFLGEPHDVAIMPNGNFAAVRSERAVGLIRLDGANSGRVWGKRLFGDPGPMGNSAMDSIEVTNNRIATISRWESAGNFGAQLDVFTLGGVQKTRLMQGDPHDLAITPNGRRLVVRTSSQVVLYDIQNLPSTDFIIPLDTETLNSTHTSFGAGLDSVAVTDDRAVTFARNDDRTRVRFWDISGDTLERYNNFSMPERATDLDITPDETRVVISGLTYAMAFLLETGEPIFVHDPADGGGFPWSDGVALNNERAVFFGYITDTGVGGLTFDGWYTLVDLFRDAVEYCGSNPNSSGEAGLLELTGSASLSANNLALRAFHLPAAARGVFTYGDGQSNTPFGGGNLCVAGNSAFFPVQLTSGDGTADLFVDNMNLPGGAILPGSTWNFQFLFRDLAGGSNQSTNALSLQFEN